MSGGLEFDPRGSLTLAPPPGMAAESRYQTVEPLLALLSAEEQRALQARFAFDPFKWGRVTALGLVLLSGAGIVSSLLALGKGTGDLPALSSLIVALALLFEQLARLRTLRTVPAGSVLGFLVRPLARRLFEEEP